MTKRVARKADSAKTHVNRAAFSIVGIGASAGGLEAIEGFLRAVPEESGLAFVVVQHLDPTHKGMLAEILQRSTTMPVRQIVDRTEVAPDCVYVIPPNKDLSILHGVLHLLQPIEARGHRMPIDFFFKSLADDIDSRAVGVVLSGMGSDGTLGLQAIKDKAGLALVQDPATCRFDAMPQSAIKAGVADVVAPIEVLPGRIADWLRRPFLTVEPALARVDKSRAALEKVVILLRTRTGHDFSLYKRNTMYRRVERRMGIHQLQTLSAYVRLLQESPHEADLLFSELLIGVTGFFRDPLVWQNLKTNILPAMLTNRPANRPLRIWVPACSTGEEAYTLAILCREVLESIEASREQTVQIFATDLNADAVQKARVGTYGEGTALEVSSERLQRYFTRTNDGYQIEKFIRDSVIFAQQDVFADPPFTRMDFVSCRNLLIYLIPDAQKRLLSLFHYALNPAGILLLGSAETVSDDQHLFVPVDSTSRCYRRVENVDHGRVRTQPPSLSGGELTGRTRNPKHHATVEAAAAELLLQRFAPVSILVNDGGDILYINGRSGRYLEPPAGRANWNVFVMAREGLRFELTETFRQAKHSGKSVARDHVQVQTDSGVHLTDIVVEPLQEPGRLHGNLLILLKETSAPEPPKRQPRAPAKSISADDALNHELEQARRELSIIREEMHVAQEEARSATEEMLSANEEMQATNEELMTSKEEMQSMNEELQTLNGEQQRRVEDLSRMNSDLVNLLNSAEIATIFLDKELHLRLFTSGAARLFRLLPTDVGRPITDITSILEYPALANDARHVLRTRAVHEVTVSGANEQWFQVRVMPYKTVENIIDGVAITFRDISEATATLAALRSTQVELEGQVATRDTAISAATDALVTERQLRISERAGHEHGNTPDGSA